MLRVDEGRFSISARLTLVVVPVVYTYLDGLRPETVREWFARRRRRKAAAKAETPAPAEQQPA